MKKYAAIAYDAGSSRAVDTVISAQSGNNVQVDKMNETHARVTEEMFQCADKYHGLLLGLSDGRPEFSDAARFMSRNPNLKIVCIEDFPRTAGSLPDQTIELKPDAACIIAPDADGELTTLYPQVFEVGVPDHWKDDVAKVRQAAALKEEGAVRIEGIDGREIPIDESFLVYVSGFLDPEYELTLLQAISKAHAQGKEIIPIFRAHPGEKKSASKSDIQKRDTWLSAQPKVLGVDNADTAYHGIADAVILHPGATAGQWLLASDSQKRVITVDEVIRPQHRQTGTDYRGLAEPTTYYIDSIAELPTALVRLTSSDVWQHVYNLLQKNIPSVSNERGFGTRVLSALKKL